MKVSYKKNQLAKVTKVFKNGESITCEKNTKLVEKPLNKPKQWYVMDYDSGYLEDKFYEAKNYTCLELSFSFSAHNLSQVQNTLERLTKNNFVFNRTTELRLSLYAVESDDGIDADTLRKCFQILLSQKLLSVIKEIHFSFDDCDVELTYGNVDPISDALSTISTLRSVTISGAEGIFSGMVKALKSSPIETLQLENGEFPIDDVVFLIKSKPLEQLAINPNSLAKFRSVKKNHTTFLDKDCCIILDLSVRSENAEESQEISTLLSELNLNKLHISGTPVKLSDLEHLQIQELTISSAKEFDSDYLRLSKGSQLATHIRKLVLNNVSFDDSQAQALFTLISELNLHELEINYCKFNIDEGRYNKNILKVIKSLQTKNNLISLNLSALSPHMSLETTQDVLKALPESLRHLDLYRSTNAVPSKNIFDAVHACRKLRTIAIDGDINQSVAKVLFDRVIS